MPPNRAKGRNVWVEFSSAPGEIQGGLRAPGNMTTAQFLDMLHVVFSSPGGFKTRLRDHPAPLTASDGVIEPGYYILTPSFPGEEMHTSNERFFPRTLSRSVSPRDNLFRDEVRERDGRCVITGQENDGAVDDDWIGFEAVHIVPLALQSISIKHEVSQAEINSPQNGLLLLSHIKHLWDNYAISVNPYDGYKIQAFSRTGWYLHGKVSNPTCRQPDNPASVKDALLRWHYEQAVLCNVRGAGEPLFEHDFPPGSDMLGETREGPQPAERMEAELFSRLYGAQPRPESEFADNKN